MSKANRLSFLLLLAIVLLASLWIIFAKLVAPPLITSAYRGESWPLLNKLVSNQALYSVDHYLGLWQKVTRRGLITLLVLGIAFLLLARPEFQRFMDARRASRKEGETPSDPPATLGKRRLWLINGLIVVIVVGTLSEYVTGAENWPFSSYSMYSRVKHGRQQIVLRVFGLTDEETPREVPLIAYRYIQPFDHLRLWFGLAQIIRKKDGERLAREALQDCLARYEARRRNGRHDGPPLQAVRLYRLTWELDLLLLKVDRPDRRELLLEVALPRGDAG